MAYGSLQFFWFGKWIAYQKWGVLMLLLNHWLRGPNWGSKELSYSTIIIILFHNSWSDSLAMEQNASLCSWYGSDIWFCREHCDLLRNNRSSYLFMLLKHYLAKLEQVLQQWLKYLVAEQKFAIFTTLQKFLLSLSPRHECPLGFPGKEEITM